MTITDTIDTAPFAHLAHVPVPIGGRVADDWQPGTPLPYRVIQTALWIIDGHGARVWGTAVQYADGAIEVEGVSVEIAWEDRLTSGQARQLARAQMAAADVIDGWVAG